MNLMKFVKLFAAKIGLWLTATLVMCVSLAHAQTTPSDAQSKTKFADKIGHWLYAYGMSSPDFLTEDRAAFKEKAFAEVYVEATIDYDAWMFNLLNKVTKFRYPAKQMPHIIFEVKFTPTDATLTKYSIGFAIQATSEVSVNLQTIANEAAASLSGKTYTEPAQAVEDVEKAIKAALTKLAGKLDSDLAPNLLVRYANEVFWSGHEVPILENEGDYVELEAVDKTGTPINPSLLTWTNADPFESKGVVNMTGVNSKEVTLVKKGEEKEPLVVTLKRVGTSDDINELLKMLIVEVLSTKKQQARDTIVLLKQDSVHNLDSLSMQIALLESDNLEMEETGTTFQSLYDEPQYFPDSAAFFHSDRQKTRGFQLLKKRKKIHSAIRRKVNVVAFADLVVDKPDMVKVLLDELLKNSGRLIARLILNRDSKGQRDEARNIVVDFLNKNLERIAGNHYPESLSIARPLPPVVIRAQLPKYQPGMLYHISSRVNFPGRVAFEDSLKTYLAKLDTPIFVTVNYSQDVTSESFTARNKGTRPKGLPLDHKYITFTLVNIPGSVKFTIKKAANIPSRFVTSTSPEIGGRMFDEFPIAPRSIEVTELPGEICNEGGGSATFLSPAGSLVILPAVGVKSLIFAYGFNSLENSGIVPGTLLSFTINETTYAAVSGPVHDGYYDTKNVAYAPENHIKDQTYIEAGKKYFTMLLPCATNGKKIKLVKFKSDGLNLQVDDKTVRDKYTVSNFPLRLFSKVQKANEKSYPIGDLPSIIQTLGDFRQQLAEETFGFFEYVCEDETIIPRFKGAEYYNLYPIFVTNFMTGKVLLGASTYDKWLEFLADLDEALNQNQTDLSAILSKLPQTWSTMTNLQFEELMRMMSVTDFENLSLENRLLLLRITADFSSHDLGDLYLKNLIVYTPDKDQKALLSGLIMYKSRENKNNHSILQMLLRDWDGIDGQAFTEAVTTLSSWAVRHSPPPETFTIERALAEKKFIDYNEGVWLGDIFEEEFTTNGDIFLSAQPQLGFSSTQVKARPFEYIYIRFHEEYMLGSYQITAGQEVKLPALFAYMLFNNQNTERIRVGTRLAFDVAMLALGVGELNLALRAQNSWRLYKAIADVGISIADIGITNALAPYVEKSQKGKQLLSHWNTFMLFYAVGSVGEVVYSAALNNMRYTADEMISQGILVQEDGTLKALSSGEKLEIDNMVKNAEAASGLKANALLATVRTDVVPEDILKQIFGISDDLALRLSRVNNIDNLYKNPGLMARINSLGANKTAFLEDLTNTAQYFKPPISERIADLDEQMIDVWEVMKNNGDGWPRKRLSYDYLNDNKNLTKDEILDDLRGTSSRDVMAARIEASCPECSKAIKEAYKLNANVRSYIIPKILSGDIAPNGKKWADIYLNFIDDATRLRYINFDTKAFDWNAFFTLEKYQAHHYFPVNLFADDAGAFRFMFEKISSSKKQQLADFFNSQKNGILVPNKRIVNGQEYIIHTNHHDYELRLSEFLNAKKIGYDADGLADDVIAELLYEDILGVNLQDLVIEKSLLGNTNINDLNLDNILKP